MPPPRELTDVAIDCALHQLPEPRNGWRKHLPPEDLGAMVDSGSGQISLQAAVAALHYGDHGRAVRTLRRYAELCPKRFMLSEPWSWIYGKAIFCCWAAVVVIAERNGTPEERELATLFRSLLARWAGTCALMEVNGKVLMAGCRCWGHEVKGGGWDDLWAVAAGRKDAPAPGSKKYGHPGTYDDWGWMNRCAHLAQRELRAITAPFLGRDWRSLVPQIPRWGARTPLQLIGWEDGSRLSIMGLDESARVDEDENGNTPGWLAAGVVGGKIVTLPRWPNPFDGKERLRQVACKADIDGTPEIGWSLWHSHLGETPGAVGGYVTLLRAYRASPIAFWLECPRGETVWQVREPRQMVYPAPIPPPAEPGTIPPKAGKKRRRWWEFWR